MFLFFIFYENKKHTLKSRTTKTNTRYEESIATANEYDVQWLAESGAC